MALDPTIHDLNRASTGRIRELAARLSDVELMHPVGPDWTVAILLAHLAFWDRRVLYVLEMTRKDGEVFIPTIDIFINDLLQPLLAAIPPREAARLAIETAEETDRKLATYPADLLDKIYAHNKRWVNRSLHRNEHLDEAEAALIN